MKAHLTIPAAAFSTLLAAALATGNPLLYLLAILSLLTIAFCLAGVLWASSTMQITA